MKVLLRGFFLLFCLGGSLAFGLSRQAEMRAQGVGYAYDYLQYLPKDYDAVPAAHWPLLIFLHGSGQTGTVVARVADTGLPAEIEKGRDFQAVILSPQSQVYGWNADALEAFIDEVSHQYRVDRERICLTGLSMGGIGTWNLAMRHPERYAAVAPICGYGNTALAAQMKALPVWAFHGMQDATIAYTYSTTMIEAIQLAGGDPRLTLFPALGHDVWTPVYGGTEIFTWLFAQRRGHPVPQFQGETGGGVELAVDTLPSGTGSYKWELLGTSGFEIITDGSLSAWGNTQASGASSSTLRLTQVSSTLAGHQLRCTGTGMSTVSSVYFTLNVGSLPQAVAVEGFPSGIQQAGTPVALRVVQPESGVTYQWCRNLEAIPGATGSSYDFVTGMTNGGLYSLQATNAAGMLRSIELGSLQVSTQAALSNLSARAYVQTGEKVLVAGFATSASTGEEKRILVRGIGPALRQPGYGVSGALGSTHLRLYDAAAVLLGSNGAWDAGLASLFAELGAFTLPSDSADSALVWSVKDGRYTAQVASMDGSSGVGMVELYDTAVTEPALRLSNLSARAQVESGERVLVCGFVIVGQESATVLLRGVGPALGRYGISAPLAKPVLTVFDAAGRVIASNAGWQTAVVNGASPVAVGVDPATDALMDLVGAFYFNLGSADCAMVLTLPPGLYTAQVSGLGGSSGVGLAEVYEIR
jgi:predicted esterase